MADFNEIKDTLSDTFNYVAGKTKEFAGIASAKAKVLSKIAKLNMELGGEKDTIQKAYIEIGKLYYDTRKNDPDGFFVQLCDEITLAKENIEKLQKEIEDLKADVSSKGESDVDVEFTNVEPEAEAAEEPKAEEPHTEEPKTEE